MKSKTKQTELESAAMSRQPPTPGKQVLLDEVACTYAGQNYSGGANVKMPASGGGEVVKTCDGNSGTWY